MIRIPYARRAPYDNAAYVTAMADLMLRRGDLEADAARRTALVGVNQWNRAGDIAMSTLGNIGAQRERERALAIEAQQRAFENQLKTQQLQEAQAERAAAEQWRRDQFREAQASASADDLAPGSVVSPEDYRGAFAGTSAQRRFQHRAAVPERLPARPVATGVMETFPTTDASQRDYLQPMSAVMSSDTAARPEGYQRVPSWQESAQAEQLGISRENAALTRENILADNARADRTAEETRKWREANLALQTRRTVAAEQRARAGEIPTDVTAGAPDPDSQDLLSQAGLSYNAFLALSGRMAQLPRDAATRARASAEVQQWARNKGVDVSTLASRFKAVNETLETNIRRRNMVLNIQDELTGDIANLKTAAQQAGLGDARAINSAKLWATGQLNDPNASDYAFALNALVNDLALYNAASTGRTADQSDINEAKQVVLRGMATGSLTGLETSLNRSVQNMNDVLERSVERSRRDVWDVFGVGDKYKPRAKTPPPEKWW